MAIVNLLLDYVNTTTVIVGLTVLIAIYWLRQPRDRPPGPSYSFPIIGFLSSLRQNNPEDLYGDVYNKYGPIVSYNTGSLHQIALLNFEATKEGFIKDGDNFAGKPQEKGFKIDPNETGIQFLEGEAWKEHRRFVLSTFRDFGMGKHSLEPRIMEEINAFMDELTKQNELPMDWSKLLGISLANVVCALEFGSRFEYDDPEFLHLRSLLADGEQLLKSIIFKLVFPRWMQYIPFFNYFCGWNYLRKLHDGLEVFFTKKMLEHRKAYQEDSRRDLIDAFFTEKIHIVEKSGDDSNFTDDILKGTLKFLFIAAADTIVATIRWSFAILLTYPDVQKKILAEIDDVIGAERNPSISDRANMVYTEAFFNEVLRYGSVFPIIMHTTLEETKIMGYRIPRRTNVLTSLHRIHYEEGLWGDPKTFRPERFIDDNGKLTKPEHFLAFGVGKRNCIGESLARMEIFLYFTSILQRFELRVPEGETISLQSVIGFIRNPKPYKLCFKPRKQ